MGKKDFEGKNKTSKTYDKDWVFDKKQGAWVTQKQARAAREDRKEAKAYNQAIRNPKSAIVPGAGGKPATVPILGGGLVPLPNSKVPKIDPGLTPEPEPGTVGIVPGGKGPKVPLPMGPDEPPGAEPQYSGGVKNPKPKAPAGKEPKAPSWWINAAIQNPKTEEERFANMANAILPTLSPEDQRTLATYLAQNYKNVYGKYANINFPQAPTEMTSELRNSYLSPDRAKLALTLLEKMKTASGAQNMGAGYQFLRSAVNLMNQFSSGGVMTREKYQQFQNAVSNMQKNAGGDLSAYANLAQLFNLPSFTAGPLVSNTPNNKLFT